MAIKSSAPHAWTVGDLGAFYTEHALAYLHRTIANLSIDYFRAAVRRPNLALLDDYIGENS